MAFAKQISALMLSTGAWAPSGAGGVAVAYQKPFASQPINLGLCRAGGIQLQALAAQNLGGAQVKLQGTNVGIGIDVTAVAASGRSLDLGGLNPTDLGWADLGIEAQIPPNINYSQFIPPFPPQGQGGVLFDINWLRLVVRAVGPGGITLNAWAKFRTF